MPEIGAMLREARMRARVDISEIEERTKIRAKYLRALENEEWDLLPGPAYVKSFLRTYADALGLDARLIVEEYKLRHERMSDFDLQPIRSPAARERRARQGRGPVVPPRWIAGGVLVVVLLVLLYALGSGSGGGSPTVSTNRITTTGASGASGSTGAAGGARHSQRVALQLVPSAPVWVCLVTSSGHRLINGVILTPGTTQPTYRAKRLKMTFGNGLLRMRVDGHLLSVPSVNNPIGYELTRAAGRKLLPTAQRPTCA